MAFRAQGFPSRPATACLSPNDGPPPPPEPGFETVIPGPLGLALKIEVRDLQGPKSGHLYRGVVQQHPVVPACSCTYYDWIRKEGRLYLSQGFR